MNPLMDLFNKTTPQSLMSFAQMVNMLNGGTSPQQVLNLLAQQNPQAAQAIQMLQGKSPQELEKIMRTLCANKGINFDQAFAQFKQTIGKK